MPRIQLVKIPYRITGPAMVKIFAPTPKTWPSFLYSMAGAATELANPVIGTRAPAPPKVTSLWYRFSPVSRALRAIRISEHQAAASFYEIPL